MPSKGLVGLSQMLRASNSPVLQLKKRQEFQKRTNLIKLSQAKEGQ
jgi:hypothetical protein